MTPNEVFFFFVFSTHFDPCERLIIQMWVNFTVQPAWIHSCCLLDASWDTDLSKACSTLEACLYSSISAGYVCLLWPGNASIGPCVPLSPPLAIRRVPSSPSLFSHIGIDMQAKHDLHPW